MCKPFVRQKKKITSKDYDSVVLSKLLLVSVFVVSLMWMNEECGVQFGT